MAKRNRSSAPSTTNQYFIHPIGSINLAHIRIPSPFFKRFKEEEREKEYVKLVSSQMSGEWNVKREGERLTDGWKEFTEVYNLKIGDHVIFKHRGNSVFEVTALGPSGCQINYKNNDTSQAAKQTETLSGSATKKQQHVKEGGTSSKRKRQEEIAAMDDATPSFRTKITKLNGKTVPEDPNVFYQTVTETNLERNSVHFPKHFVRIHDLDDRQSYAAEITNIDGNVWKAAADLCVDGRLMIGGGWTEFCVENNIQIGNCCEFKLLADRNPLIIDLVSVSCENQMAFDRDNRAAPRSANEEDQCSSQGENTADNMTDTTGEKGQSSKQ